MKFNFWCWIGIHDFVKSGGTRVPGGLHRKCEICGLREEGFEGETPSGMRTIVWVKEHLTGN